LIKGLSKITTTSRKVHPNIYMLDFRIVNVYMIGNANGWVLVDTGLENSASYIFKMSEIYFGKNTKPKAIILTHGHFDHVGSIKQLLERWNVPVYAHELEIPYLTGQKDYPKPDPTVDGGMVSELSPNFPHSAIDISDHLFTLPPKGVIFELPNWRYIHTPGHTEGHISLFNDLEQILIAGDAFSTLKQESMLSVLTKKEQISGPPAYLTTDWEKSYQSVKVLRDLKPKFALLSHGNPISGDELTSHLDLLVYHFRQIAMPMEGKYL
jgi:glyoxylase-like metal-dependent hydrolase (beta-lactamase superfamily II)